MSSRKRELTSPVVNTDNKRSLIEKSHSVSEESSQDDNLHTTQTMASSPVLTTNTESCGLTLKSEDIKLLAQELQALMLPAIQEMVTKAVENSTSACMQEIEKLKSGNESLRQENEELVDRICDLEQQMDDAEQYSRRNCLRIQGIPEETDENTDAVVLELSKALKVDLSVTNIDRSHRVGKPGQSDSAPRAIIVKFASYRARQLLFNKRKDLRDVADYKDVYINEDLTRKRSRLMFVARKHVKNKLLTGVWSSDGNVFVRDKLDNKYKVKQESDITVVVAAFAPELS